jgi:hypothetical protein
MKILLAISVLFLAGCSIILPRPHDPVMFSYLVETKIALSQTNCENKDWANIETQVSRMKVYTELRKDPQSNTVVDLQEALTKAKASKSKLFCDSVLRVQKERLDVIANAWRGR